MNTIIVSDPPKISQTFDKHMLEPFYDFYLRWAQVLRILAHKRYRAQDTGKKLQFLNTYNEFMELYERTKAKEVELTAARKKKVEERSDNKAKTTHQGS